jgi:predicted kinase
MSGTDPATQPLLVIVTGRPGSGKTTLAYALAREIHCPVLSRDEFKEGYVNTVGGTHDGLNDAINWGIYETFFQAIELLLSRQITLVAEAAFQHKLWSPKLASLRTLARVRLIICTVNPALARRRFIERGLADATRQRFHGDRAVHAARQGIHLPLGNYDPPQSDLPTLTVDTTDGYRPDLAGIMSFACAPK